MSSSTRAIFRYIPNNSCHTDRAEATDAPAQAELFTPDIPAADGDVIALGSTRARLQGNPRSRAGNSFLFL